MLLVQIGRPLLRLMSFSGLPVIIYQTLEMTLSKEALAMIYYIVSLNYWVKT